MSYLLAMAGTLIHTNQWLKTIKSMLVDHLMTKDQVSLHTMGWKLLKNSVYLYRKKSALLSVLMKKVAGGIWIITSNTKKNLISAFHLMPNFQSLTGKKEISHCSLTSAHQMKAAIHCNHSRAACVQTWCQDLPLPKWPCLQQVTLRNLKSH